jgi:high frequency lysogenization protein
VFRFEWQAASEVFGDAERLARGLKLLSVLLRDPAMPGHRALLWQVLALLHLGRRLSRDPQMLTRLRARLEHAAVKSAHFSSAFDELATSLAAIYQDTISTYPLRIRVNGNAQHLQDARVAARIRALLLAGLRAAVLWRHLGGSRGALLLQRRQLLGACHRLQQPPAFGAGRALAPRHRVSSPRSPAWRRSHPAEPAWSCPN